MKTHLSFLLKKVKENRNKKLIAHIEKADDHLIQQVIQAVIRRYSAAYPDWEVIFYALPKNPQKRQKELQALIHFLQAHELKANT